MGPGLRHTGVVVMCELNVIQPRRGKRKSTCSEAGHRSITVLGYNIHIHRLAHNIIATPLPRRGRGPPPSLSSGPAWCEIAACGRLVGGAS